MRSFIGLDAMSSDELYEWLKAHREDLRRFPGLKTGSAAQRWGQTCCGLIVCILARRNEPRKEKPPEIVLPAASESIPPSKEINRL